MAKSSAGIILYRTLNETIEILLGHMGGPFWIKKDEHAWTVPKGEFEPNEETPTDAARREFREETGLDLLEELQPLSPFLKNNKKHYFFLLKKNVASVGLKSNTFEMEWPPKSGKIASFPELDRFSWFELSEARIKLVKGQLPTIEMIDEILNKP